MSPQKKTAAHGRDSGRFRSPSCTKPRFCTGVLWVIPERKQLNPPWYRGGMESYIHSKLGFWGLCWCMCAGCIAAPAGCVQPLPVAPLASTELLENRMFPAPASGHLGPAWSCRVPVSHAVASDGGYAPQKKHIAPFALSHFVHIFIAISS